MLNENSKSFTVEKGEFKTKTTIRKGGIFKTRKSARLYCKSIYHLLSYRQFLMIKDDSGNSEKFTYTHPY